MTCFDRFRFVRLGAAGAALCTLALPAVAPAQGDLLVAPTRVVMSGGGATQVILSNIGATPATYRISLELRRMTAEGNFDDVETSAATAAEQAAMAMVTYAPRRITLQPGQPQSVRISARPGAELPNGEYRVHMMFRAIPDPTLAAKAIEQTDQSTFAIKLIPIYGLTIPLIVRKGQLSAAAAIANPRVERRDGVTTFKVDLQRTGDRSVFGDITIAPRGGGKPFYTAKGFAVYPELNSRTVSLQLASDEAAAFTGPVHIEYREPAEAGGKLMAALDATLP